MATLALKPQGRKLITLKVFDSFEEVEGPITHKSLLKACPFGLLYSDGIIQSI